MRSIAALILGVFVVVAASCTSIGPGESTPTAPPSETVTQLPATSPVARGYAMMADLPGKPGVVLLGGKLPSIPRWPDLPEMWTYAPGPGWQQLMPPALPVLPDYGTGVIGTAFAFDTGSGKGVFVDSLGNAWTYDSRSNAWEAQSRTHGPTALLGVTMVYDARSDRMIVFGGLDIGGCEDLTGPGCNFSYNKETWAYDLDSNTWEQMDPEQSPSPRNYYQMAYDEGSDRVVLFGGGRDVGAFGDTWAYDYETDTWTEMSPSESPPARTYGWMVYDPGSDRTILYGGSEDQDTATFGDTWAYDVDRNEWTRLAVDGPSARAWHAMSYDDRTGTVVLFGGGTSRDDFTAETWILDLRAETWSQVA